MKKVWFDLSENDAELVLKVLDEYCVPRKKRSHEVFGLFYTAYKYDIEVDLSIDEIMTTKKGKISPYDFITKKVDEIFQLRDDFDLPAKRHPLLVEDKERIAKEKLECKRINIKNPIIEQQDEPWYKILWHNLKLGFKRKDLKSKSIIDFINSNSRKHNLDFEKIIEDSFRKQFMPPFLDIPKCFESKMQGKVEGCKEIKFDDLSSFIKQSLTMIYPVEVLRSDKCKIYQSGNQISVIIN